MMEADPDLARVAGALVDRLGDAVDSLGLPFEDAAARIGWSPGQLLRTLSGDEEIDDIGPLLKALAALGCGVIVRIGRPLSRKGIVEVVDPEEDI